MKNQPVYFDLDAEAATMRKAFAAVNAGTPDNLGKNETALVRIQQHLQEAQVSFHVEMLRCINENIKPDIAIEALGNVIGDIIYRAVTQTNNPQLQLNNLMVVIGEAISSMGSPETAKHSIREPFAQNPIVGGNA
jgi:hypothetical protein